MATTTMRLVSRRTSSLPLALVVLSCSSTSHSAAAWAFRSSTSFLGRTISFSMHRQAASSLASASFSSSSPPSSSTIHGSGGETNKPQEDVRFMGELETSKVGIRVLGVCGGIGSGKSQASQLLVNELKCWAHLEADVIAHKVYEPNSLAVQEIVKEFGSQILLEDGTVNRKELGSIVFSSPKRMSTLEHIVWPHVKTEIQRMVDSYKEKVVDIPMDTKPVIVLEAAVLVDAGWEDMLDGLWVIRVPEALALERLESQRGLAAHDAKQRIDAQQARRSIGNLQEEVDNGVVSCVIVNDGTRDQLREKLANALDDENCWYKA